MHKLNELSIKKDLNSVLEGSYFLSKAKPKVSFKKLYIESYGCQMNLSDSEIVVSILSKEGYKYVENYLEAELILLNTCSIREKAEITIRKKLKKFNILKYKNKNVKIGILGCMAERLKSKLLEEEKIVDLVVGPDAYKDLPNLLKEVDEGKEAINVLLSKDETYGEISPVRINSNKVSAFVTITRGCDNMCTFCVVPFTRGRERSRDPKSILNEIKELKNKGFKEITLLGQNVDSYLWYGGGLKKDFINAPKINQKNSIKFSDLLDIVATNFKKIRIRFSTSNPQDMTIDVINVMSKHPNICKHIHLPVQSGSDRILRLMNRKHTISEYYELIDNIKKIIPDCAISHDLIVGFPSETENDHIKTINLMNKVKYNYGFMFYYSERPGTLAEKKMEDNVSLKIKKQRLSEIIEIQQKHSFFRTKEFIGKNVEVLIEKTSKKSNDFWSGRNSQNTVVVFPKENFKIGDMIKVEILNCTSATLIGKGIKKIN